jgi:AcrR family transcriptional regulator
MAEAVAEHSYGATTIAHVVSHAGVSRKTFYEHFRDKEHCFLAMYDTGISFVLGRIVETLEKYPDPRERLVEGLRALPVETFPSGANFVLLRVGGRGSSERTRQVGAVDEGHRVWQGLVDRGVLVRDCSGWPRLGGCLRVTVGTPPENDRFLAALGEVLA